MRALIQRVTYGSVKVNGEIIAEIQKGIVILLGIGLEDSEKEASLLAAKISLLRIFNDGNGKMNLSILDVGGEVLVVPQFTLYANTIGGHRPEFIQAAPSPIARPLVEYFALEMGLLGIHTQTGRFGADMLVEIHNDGPVTIWMEN